ncbi:MAG: hypothetical protein WC972_10310 [Trueperaceae bacterium]|jgi:hypothetical protein|nr:hypothetical protein [Truepera sp.]
MTPGEAKPTAAPVRPKPGRRPKFDKAASTTWLLAALIGVGAGATWQLLRAQASPVQAASPTQLVVVDTSGRVMAVYPSLALNSASQAQLGTRVTLAPGRSRSAKASTRAS